MVFFLCGKNELKGICLVHATNDKGVFNVVLGFSTHKIQLFRVLIDTF